MEVILAVALLVAVLLPYHQTGGAGGKRGDGTSTSGRGNRVAEEEDDSGPHTVMFTDVGDILNIDRNDFEAIADELLAHWENNIRVLSELHETTVEQLGTPSCKITLKSFKVQGTSQRSSTTDTLAEVVWVKVVEKNFAFCALMETKPKQRGGCTKSSSEVCLQAINGMQLAFKLWFDKTLNHKIEVGGLNKYRMQVAIEKTFGKGKQPQMEDEGWTKVTDALLERLGQHLTFSILSPMQATVRQLESEHNAPGQGVKLMKSIDIESTSAQ